MKAASDTRPSRISRLLTITCLLLGAAARLAGSDTAVDGAAYVYRLNTQRAGKYLGVPIKDLPVGTWVLAENPETDGNFGFDYGELNANELRIVRLRMDKREGGVLWIERIELAEFLVEDGVTVGFRQFEEYEDLGIEGEAEVVEISPCPPLTRRPSERHCLVTSKFTHDAANVIDLALSGQSEPIGVTANHPIWSEDRQSFIPAGELRYGERLLSADGGITTVAMLALRPGLHPVYNLEVDGEHVYHVSPAGLLVHNSCSANAKALGRNLAREGRAPGFGEAAGHIVASGGTLNQWEDAARTRKLLERFRIGINDAANGIPIGAPRPHNTMHTEAFNRNVHQRVLAVADRMQSRGYGTKATRSAIRRELRKIGSEILKGVFPW